MGDTDRRKSIFPKGAPRWIVLGLFFIMASWSFLPKAILAAQLWNVSRVRLIDAGVHHGKLVGPTQKILFDSKEPQDIATVKRLLSVRGDGIWFNQCLCFGSPSLQFYEGDQVRLVIAVQHGKKIRLPFWIADFSLENPEDFVDWLEAHGDLGTAHWLAYSDPHYTRIIDQRELTQFQKTMPDSLRSYLGPLHIAASDGRTSYVLSDMSGNMNGISREQQIKGARSALAEEFPFEQNQIRRLLEWSADARPAALYQYFPVEMLLDYDHSEILAVAKAKSKQPTSRQWIGLARFYSYMGFRDKYPFGYVPLDNNLKQRILNELQATGKNEADVSEFREAITTWMYPVRLERILEKQKKNQLTAPQ